MIFARSVTGIRELAEKVSALQWSLPARKILGWMQWCRLWGAGAPWFDIWRFYFLALEQFLQSFQFATQPSRSCQRMVLAGTVDVGFDTLMLECFLIPTRCCEVCLLNCSEICPPTLVTRILGLAVSLASKLVSLIFFMGLVVDLISCSNFTTVWAKTSH